MSKCKCGARLRGVLAHEFAQQCNAWDEWAYKGENVHQPTMIGQVTATCHHGNAHMINLDEVAMTYMYGERCEEYEPGCAVCEAYRVRDRIGRMPTEQVIELFADELPKPADELPKEEPETWLLADDGGDFSRMTTPIARIRIGKVKWKVTA